MAQELINVPPTTDDSSSDDENNETAAKFVSCNTIRKKITLFLATKEMTQTAFLSAIGGVNSNSFGRFMKSKGPFGGCDNGTYEGARKFFAQREKKLKNDLEAAKQKKKLEKKKRPIANTETGSSVVEPPSKIVVREVVLPDDLPVYDDCDEIRTKIGKCLHVDKLSQSAFARAIGVSAGAVSNFLAKKGFNQGAGSVVYPNAYRYFEKKRLERGEAKSKHRLNSERNHPQGYALMNPPTHMWVFTGKK